MTRRAAVDDLGLPETDRTQRGADLSLTENVGPFSLGQAVSWQDFTDQVQPLSDQTVTGLAFTASGGLTSDLNLSANVSNTRTKAGPGIGTTDQLLVSLQPSLSLAKLWLAVTPRTAWTRVTNDLDDSKFRTDQYQLVVRWSPPWAGALLNLEVASDLNRSWTQLDDLPAFDRQTVLTLTLNWRAIEPGERSLRWQDVTNRSRTTGRDRGKPGPFLGIQAKRMGILKPILIQP